MKQKLTKNMTVIIFVSMIFILSLVNLINEDRVFSESENRFLAKKPKFTWEALFNKTYTADVEKYITDQFIWRDIFVGMKTQTEYLLGKKDTNNVYFSKDDYLIEKHDATSINKDLLNKNIEKLYEFIETTSNNLGHNNVSLMLIPTASNILNYKLPSYATQFNQDIMLDSIKENLNNGNFIDVRPLLNNNSDEYIYYKTDHHWTTLGAYYGYLSWCNEMGIDAMKKEDFDIKIASIDFYGTIYSKARLRTTKPDTIYTYIPKSPLTYEVDYNQGSKVSNTLYENEFLDKRDKYSFFLGGNNPLVKISSSNKNGKKLLLIKDSFAHCFAPFIANEFEEVHMVDLRYLNISLESYIDENNISDVLILYSTVNFANESNIIKLNK